LLILLSLDSGDEAGSDNSDARVVLSVNDEEKTLAGGHADDYQAVFVFGVLVVWQGQLNGSAKTVAASSKETPCFFRLLTALAGLNSKLTRG
jgi:hypothetical protein